MKSFQATHHLISRSRQIPVCLVRKGNVFAVFSEQEWGTTNAPAFELHPKLGIFCRGVKVVGHSLKPLSDLKSVSQPESPAEPQPEPQSV